MKRVIVCGGRDYHNRDKIYSVLNDVCPTYLIHGGATGADYHAGVWAMENLLPDRHFVVPADWRKLGNAAGPIRNQKMIDEYSPDMVIAFPGGRGTADMVRRARASGLIVMEVK